MSYAKLHFRQNCVYGYLSLSCVMSSVYDTEGFLQGWVTALPPAQGSLPPLHTASAKWKYKDPGYPSGLWKLSELPSSLVFIFFCLTGIQCLRLTRKWDTVPHTGQVNKNKLDKETTKQSHHGQTIAGSFNDGGKVREVTDLDNRVRLSSANSDQVSEGPR